MKEECLICKAPLEYLVQDELMECAICHKQELSKTRCVKGHYACSDCHTQGMDSIFGICLSETSCDPIAILEKMMSMPTAGSVRTGSSLVPTPIPRRSSEAVSNLRSFLRRINRKSCGIMRCDCLKRI